MWTRAYKASHSASTGYELPQASPLSPPAAAPPYLAWRWGRRWISAAERRRNRRGRSAAAASGPSGGDALEGTVAASGAGGGGEALLAPLSPHLSGRAAVKVEKEEARSQPPQCEIPSPRSLFSAR
uniref:Uncharacterized protein n=1 Tax=Oryza sativa subsp. japonica TaxID=39947 RepID=Q69TQ8_ORYSJ|nr:hypothetical protein [Oryza sativa Japonica Group]BAD35769.1 hypothetical protein [Oryza sativa Japonica Group]